MCTSTKEVVRSTYSVYSEDMVILWRQSLPFPKTKVQPVKLDEVHTSPSQVLETCSCLLHSRGMPYHFGQRTSTWQLVNHGASWINKPHHRHQKGNFMRKCPSSPVSKEGGILKAQEHLEEAFLECFKNWFSLRQYPFRGTHCFEVEVRNKSPGCGNCVFLWSSLD